ncbi:RING finger protein PFF0165c-like [Achroia grisella]|uniref:RING finger protein PFF0165c-like n=1 Tax=Achroia grisella TaxID=688607 RepID=UPI0027D2642A|nr:RING finger protein PFF0165c-like [Achroia grisella]
MLFGNLWKVLTSFLVLYVTRLINLLIMREMTEKNLNKIKTEEDNTDTKVYVSKDIKRMIDTENKSRFKSEQLDDVYSINGEIFKIKHQETKKYQEVNIYVEKLVPHCFEMAETDEYCVSADEESEDMSTSDDGLLSITLQKVPHGVIINSVVYLTDYQWNTLVFHDVNDTRCFVCDDSISLDVCNVHITSDLHQERLNSCQPLEKFDISVIRQMTDKYHCAVCNEVFDYEFIHDHLESKTHEDNRLFAINKVIDTLESLDIENNRNISNDRYHFDANALNNNHYEYDNENCKSISVSDGDTINSNSESMKEYEDNNDYVNENENTRNYLSKEMSYASVAKKTDFVNKTNGHKWFKIPLNTWHMILVLKRNIFYCMVCKLKGSIIIKSSHCIDVDHIERLNRCEILKKYKDYFIRQVDDKQVHCEQCNNLQYNYLIDEHLDSHSGSDKYTKETSSRSNNRKGDDAINARNTNSPVQTSNRITTNTYNNTNSDNNFSNTNEIYSNMYINVLGRNMNISLMCFNVIFEHPDHYFCGLCHFKEDKSRIMLHIKTEKHINLIHTHLFLYCFGNHLVRNIRNAFHCGLCNMPMRENPEVVNNHILEPNHISKLYLALGYNAPFQILPTNNQPAQTNACVQFQNQDVNKKIDEYANTGTNSNTERVNEIALGGSEPKFAANEIKLNVDEPKLGENKIKLVDNEIKLVENEIKLGENKIKSSQKEIKLEEDEIKLVSNEIRLDDQFDVKNGSDDSIVAPFDTEAKLFVLLDKYYKITLTSYNSMVATGSGSRYCFICNVEVEPDDFKKHIARRDHEKNMQKYKFLDKYKNNLIRQTYLAYHCAICNVIIYHSDLSAHFEWDPHKQLVKQNSAISRKQRKNQIKAGLSVHKLETLSVFQVYVLRKERKIVKEKQIKTRLTAVIVDNVELRRIKYAVKLNKMVIVNGNILEVMWEAWNGIVAGTTSHKCIICQDIEIDVDTHVETQTHVDNINKSIIEKYIPNLIREINYEILNCVTCNNEMVNKEETIANHLTSKRHGKKYKKLLDKSSNVNTYENCDIDVLNLVS